MIFDAALPDEQMAEYARQAAARFSVDGRLRMRLGPLSPRHFARLAREAERLAARSGALTPDMEWLTGNVRKLGQMARALREAPAARLPAQGGDVRILALMRDLVKHSDGQIGPDRLTSTIAAYDEVQGLSMAELWLVPHALRLALVEAFYSVGQQVARDQRARLDAERWVASGAPQGMLVRAPGSAFSEHALKLLHEQDSPDARRSLEAWLEGHAGGSGGAILRAHERRAMNRLLLMGIMASIRMLDALNWDRQFDLISRAEGKLREDTVYREMDKASRARVRDQVTLISRRSGLSEWTVAHHAVCAADEMRAGLDRDDARATVCWWLYDDDGRAQLLGRLGSRGACLPLITPDPTGKRFLLAFLFMAICFFLLLWRAFAP